MNLRLPAARLDDVDIEAGGTGQYIVQHRPNHCASLNIARCGHSRDANATLFEKEQYSMSDHCRG